MKLPVSEIMLDAFRLPWNRRKEFARALLIPLIGLLAVDLISHYYWSGPNVRPNMLWVWLLLLVRAVLYTWLAVRCHRLVLLGAKIDVAHNWSIRENRFLLALIALYVMLMVFSMLVAGIIIPLLSQDFLKELMESKWWLVLISVPAWYVFARLSLVFPAIAVDRPFGITGAWNLSAGNGWRLFVVVCILPWVLSHALSLTYPSATDIPFFWPVLFTTLGTLLLVFEVCALSLCYRSLGRE
jgi:hypothetical protein